MRGPIDYIIVGFNGTTFDGGILKALGEALDSDVIKLVALSVVVKDSSGHVTLLDINESDDEYIATFAQKYAIDASSVTQEDVNEVGDLLEVDEAAGLLIIEQLWAKPLKKALVDANGFMIAEGRIHPEAAYELSEKE